MSRAILYRHLLSKLEPSQCFYISMWIKWFGCHAGCQEVSRCHTRGECEESVAHRGQSRADVIFLTLMTPSYVLYVFIIFYDFSNSASSLAGYHLFLNLTRILYYTNYGINFIFYVISGQKFRNDFMKLFLCRKRNDPENVSVETKSTVSS